MLQSVSCGSDVFPRNNLTLPFVQLICTVTPASSNSEETHNTLKFAHRSKHVEIKASANKVHSLFLLLVKMY
jgi:hypothetical protein